MPLVDLALIIFIGAFVFFGLYFGLVHTIGSLVGTIGGVLITTRIIDPVMEKAGFLFGGGMFANILWFIILLALTSRLIRFAFYLIEKIFGFVRFIPFIKSFNRLAGGLLGFIEGVLFVGVIIYFSLTIMPESLLRTWLEGSVVATYLIDTMQNIQFLFPEEYRLQ